MRNLLLLPLLLGFISSSWADPEKPSGNLQEVESWEDTSSNKAIDKDFNEASSGWEDSRVVDGDYDDTCVEIKECKTEKKKSINQGQIRKNGWQQKPTFIKKKPLNIKRK